MLVVVLVIVLRRKLQRWPFPQSCNTQLGVLLLRACHAASMPITLLGLKSRPEHSCTLQAIISQSNNATSASAAEFLACKFRPNKHMQEFTVNNKLTYVCGVKSKQKGMTLQ